MQVDKILSDSEFGHLYIKTHARAVRYTFRPAHDGGRGILITVPSRYVLSDVCCAVETMRPRLRVMMQRNELQEKQLREKPQPSAEEKAEAYRRIERLRALAKRELPPRLLALAKDFGFQVDQVKISSARSRWGSCVARKKGLFGRMQYTINLSLYCVLLPEHLQRLVMLHELTHIHHMDHSPAFHAELNGMLGGQEIRLEQELKSFRPKIDG